MSPQLRSGGGGGIHTVGYAGEQLDDGGGVVAGGVVAGGVVTGGGKGSRLSSSRAGVRPVKDELVGNQPSTSTRTSVEPVSLKIEIAPLGPMGTMTMFATVWPGVKLRFDAFGRS